MREAREKLLVFVCCLFCYLDCSVYVLIRLSRKNKELQEELHALQAQVAKVLTK